MATSAASMAQRLMLPHPGNAAKHILLRFQVALREEKRPRPANLNSPIRRILDETEEFQPTD
jgi:hypothetical protein